MKHVTRFDRYTAGDFPMVCVRSGRSATKMVPVQAYRSSAWPWFFVFNRSYQRTCSGPDHWVARTMVGMSTVDDGEVTDATRTVIHRYEHDLYNARNLDLVEELLSDPMYRHDAGGKVTEMSSADCRERIGGFFRDFERLEFKTIHLVVEGTLASWTYQLTGTANDGAQLVISSIEVFEIIDGKITRVWNAEHTPGPWA